MFSISRRFLTKEEECNGSAGWCVESKNEEVGWEEDRKK
jgi:hypothetical protein